MPKNPIGTVRRLLNHTTNYQLLGLIIEEQLGVPLSDVYQEDFALGRGVQSSTQCISAVGRLGPP